MNEPTTRVRVAWGSAAFLVVVAIFWHLLTAPMGGHGPMNVTVVATLAGIGAFIGWRAVLQGGQFGLGFGIIILTLLLLLVVHLTFSLLGLR